jgi:hypothetical protein
VTAVLEAAFTRYAHRKAELRSGRATVAIASDWRQWLADLFPRYASRPFAQRHVDLWEWLDGVRLAEASPAFVGIWPRGGAKSTSAELGCAYLAARKARRYGWYVSETQPQADDHVGNVGAMLGQPEFAARYPQLAERQVNQFGVQRAWRRNRVWTADGFVMDALGLDTASRGIKLDEQRPDFIVFDDIDRQDDGPEIVAKKIRTMTQSILPAGTDDMLVLAIQNLIHDQGIFARLAGVAEEPADFLADRVVSGPHPALIDPEYLQLADGTWTITSGTPTWDGQDLAACRRLVRRLGPSAFKREAQHDVSLLEGAMFAHLAFRHCAPKDVPDLTAIVVWVDPAVTSHDGSDSHGIQADGIAEDGTIYRLRSWEKVTTPRDSLCRAILIALEVKAQKVGVETDQGGDTWDEVYKAAWRSLVEGTDTDSYILVWPDLFGEDGKLKPGLHMPAFDSDKAGAGHGPKVHRASQMLADYERGNFVHVLGTHAVLEKALRRFPVRKPFDLTDTAYWSWQDLVDPQRAYAQVFGKSGHTQATPKPLNPREPVRDLKQLDDLKAVLGSRGWG